MSKDRGFSLIELIIAVMLASFVLVGVAVIAANMARTQIDGIRSGTSTGWSLVSYTAMIRELGDANVLAFPTADGDEADQVVVCQNWSRYMGALPGGKLDAAGVTTVIQYCVDPTLATSPETGFTLRRYSYTGNCPYPAVPSTTCPQNPGAPWTDSTVVGFRLEKIGTAKVFKRDNAVGGLRLKYVIGRQTATPNEPVPKFQSFDNLGVAMQKQYNSSLD